MSISGGTDIIGCFMLGNPNLPVIRGDTMLMPWMDVDSWNSNGKIVVRKVARKSLFLVDHLLFE